MSHVLDPKSVKDKDRIRITNLEAARMAMEHLGLRVLTDVEEQQQRGVKDPVPGRGCYRGHKTIYGGLVGDYPIPAGWQYEDVDNNAVLIGQMHKDLHHKVAQNETTRRYPTEDKYYDVGIVFSAEDQCYYPVYDFADSGGRLMGEVLGNVKREGQGVSEAYSLFMQAYHQACDVLTAAEQQQQIEFFRAGEETPDGYVVQPGEVVSYLIMEK